MDIVKINNKETPNWNGVYKTVRESEENTFEIRISLPEEDGANSVNVLELCYVFPLADYLLKNGKSLEVKIDTGSTGNEENWSAKSRIDALLRAEACRFQNNDRIRFWIDGIPYNVRDDLIKGEPIETSNLYEKANERTRDLLRGALLIQQKNKKGEEKLRILPSRKVEETEEIAAELKALAGRSAERPDANYEVEIAKREEPSRIAPILSVSMEREDSSIWLEDLLSNGEEREPGEHLQLRYLHNVCYRLRSYLEDKDNYPSSGRNRIQKKTELTGQMGSILNKKLPYMTLLSRCIWLYILRDLLESKELFGLVKDADGEEKRCLDTELIEKSYLNAVSYAEGLYQIIENACLYSNGRRAYWGMRIYRSSLSGGLEEEMKRAASNHALFEKYKRCIYSTAVDENGKSTETVVTPTLFSKKYSRLLEFYVIDEVMSGEGLLIKAEKTTKKKFYKIEELIEDNPVLKGLKESDWNQFSDDIANHYGLRLFSRIIDRNDGYTVVRSPNGTEKTDTLYRRFQANLHNKDEEEKPSFTTSFHIIVPMIPEEKNAKQMVHGQHSLLCAPQNDTPYWTSCIEIERTARPKANDIHGKAEKGRELSEQMAGVLDEFKKERNAILSLDMRKVGLFEAELLAKALFKLSVQQWRVGRPLYAAALFSANGSEAQEFVRIFASFYDKMSDADKAGEGNMFIPDILGNIQVAVCTSDPNEEEEGNAVEVNFVLSGKSPAL